MTFLLSCDLRAVELKLGSFWAVICDTDKQLFVNDKYLNQATDGM